MLGTILRHRLMHRKSSYVGLTGQKLQERNLSSEMLFPKVESVMEPEGSYVRCTVKLCPCKPGPSLAPLHIEYQIGNRGYQQPVR